MPVCLPHGVVLKASFSFAVLVHAYVCEEAQLLGGLTGFAELPTAVGGLRGALPA